MEALNDPKKFKEYVKRIVELFENVKKEWPTLDQIEGSSQRST